MKTNDSKELVEVKVTILDKIKNFIKKLFSKKTQEANDDNEIFEPKGNIKMIKVVTEESNGEKENSFINNVKIEEDPQKSRLLRLQALISEGVLDENEIPEEDKVLLHQLYDEQILDLKRTIDEYKFKINSLRMNIN